MASKSNGPCGPLTRHCRLGEAVAMEWGHVDFKGKRFSVTGGITGTKNHETRVVPLFPALESFLLRLRDGYAAPPKSQDRIAQIKNAKKAMAHACHNTGLPHITHHHLRDEHSVTRAKRMTFEAVSDE